MPVKDLSSSRLAPLDINVGGGFIYEIRPSADDLRRMGVFTAAAEAAMRDGVGADDSVSAIRDRIDPEDYDLLDSNETLARVQLGDAAYDAMVRDGIPAPDIYRFGRYSMNYHTRGEQFADAVLAAETGAPASDEGEDGEVVDFPKPSTTGRSTASANRSKTARTAGTAGSRSTSGKSSTRKRTGKK